MRLLRKMTWPISLVYGLVVNLRNQLYDRNILESKSFDIPTICVGNLSVGGTGKTPMIEFLISRLRDKHQLAVLSRGYKRKSQGFQLATQDSTAEQLGDEPFQIHRKYPEVTVAVDADRQNGIAQLKKNAHPSVILLDDAYQHRKVTPIFSILLTTYANPFFNDMYLPAGNLRDAKYASQRADCIVVTKCPSHIGQEERDTYTKRLTQSTGQFILFSTLVYDRMVYGHQTQLKLLDLKDKRFTLVTGIANPAPLVQYLKEIGLVFDHLKFPDHHAFSSAEIEKLKKKSLVLTTEKDYVRLQNKVEPLYYVKVEHQFLADGEQQLLQAIDAKI